MLDRNIARKLLEIENLPTLPAIMTQLLEVVENETSSAQDLTAILERDLAISARILRLSNSAFYGLRYKVDSIRRAVVVVGFEAVRMLALATSVFDTLSQRSQFAFVPEQFWLHSLGAAKAAQLLAMRAPQIESIESCFTAGLLHDMGKYCLALALKESYKKLVQEAQGDQKPLHDAEFPTLQTTHAAAGMWVAEKWRLPLLITDCIGYQNNQERYDGAYLTEVHIVALSSDIARAAGFGNAGDYDEPRLQLTEHLEKTISSDCIPEILEQVQEYHQEAYNFLETLQQEG